MFRKVMVPLDGSALAEQAIGQAVALARAAHAPLDLVLVHRPASLDVANDAPWNDYRRTRENTYLEAVAARLTATASVPTTQAVLEGDPADMICLRVWEVDADLVVMTTHGRTGLSRAWLGSVADGVLRNSSVPVLMLHPIAETTREPATQRGLKRILVTLDGSALAADILPVASELARCESARLELLHVVQPVPLLMPEMMATGGYMPASYSLMIPDAAATKRLVAAAKAQLAENTRILREERVECGAHVVVSDHVAQAILDEARDCGADAIAMATSGRGASRLFMGSIADKVLRGSTLPMLMLRPIAVDAAPLRAFRTRVEPLLDHIGNGSSNAGVPTSLSIEGQVGRHGSSASNT